MGSTRDIRLRLGGDILRAVREQGGSREDVELVLDERPELVTPWGGQIIETASIIRGDRDLFRIVNKKVAFRIPALPHPTLEELKSEYSWIKRIERDDSPTEAVTLRFGTVLKSTERRICGTVYKRRLIPLCGRTLGFQHRKWLRVNTPKPASLWLVIQALAGWFYLDFPGIIVVSKYGKRRIPVVDLFKKVHKDRWRETINGFDRCGRIAVSGPSTSAPH